jgi:hypothetical protein
MGALIVGGAIALGAGAYMSSKGAKSEAKSKQGFTRAAAGEVPLDYGAELTQSLKDIAKYSPQAQKQALATGAGEQDLLDALREKSAPGSKARQEKILSTIDSYLRGELSPEMQRNISRSGAAQGAARFGSLGGSIPYRAEAAALGRATEQQQMAGHGNARAISAALSNGTGTDAVEFPRRWTVADACTQKPGAIEHRQHPQRDACHTERLVSSRSSNQSGRRHGHGCRHDQLCSRWHGRWWRQRTDARLRLLQRTVNMGSSMSAPYGYGTMPNYYGR